MKLPEEYESLVTIEEDSLDREWLAQPRLFMKYALLLAEAKREHSEAKSALDVVKAEVSLDIRQSPEEYNIEKVTEGTIEAAVLLQKEYKTANAAFIQARYRMDLLTAVIEALEHRKRALENLVTLHGQAYFAEPRAKGEREVLEEVAKRGARKPMRRRK